MTRDFKQSSNGDERRSVERISMGSDKPIYLETNLDGSEVMLLVENLSVAGATLIYPEESDSLRPGSRLQESTLSLPDIGRVRLTAVVRWRIWPKVGVEFA